MWLWYNLRTKFSLLSFKFVDFPDHPRNQDGEIVEWFARQKTYILQYRKYIKLVKDYYRENLNQDPTSHKERLLTIQLFFNYCAYFLTTAIRVNTLYRTYALLDIADVNIEYYYPHGFIKNYKQEWIKISNFKNTLQWINKANEEQCRWIWDFLKKNSSKNKQDPKNENFHLYFWIAPCEFANNEERYLYIFTAIHVVFQDEDGKQTLKSMKKLWLQKERRRIAKKYKGNKVSKNKINEDIS